MSFNGNGARFTGDNGYGQDVDFGAEIAGDGATPLPVGVYMVISVATVTGFPPATAGEDIAEGDILVVKTGDVITPATNDDVVTLELTDKCDLASWTMEFSKEEIDVTTLCDSVKTYRAGKADMAGTMNGVFVAGLTDAVDGDLQEFIDIVRQDGATSWDKYEQQEEIKLGFFYINNDTNIADEMFVAAPYQTYGMSLGGEMGSAQSFTANFRFAPKTYTSDAGDTITINPTFYRIGADLSGT